MFAKEVNETSDSTLSALILTETLIEHRNICEGIASAVNVFMHFLVFSYIFHRVSRFLYRRYCGSPAKVVFFLLFFYQLDRTIAVVGGMPLYSKRV